MPSPKAPSQPRPLEPFVNPKTGILTNAATNFLTQLWRQFAPGFPVMPVSIEGTNNLSLMPVLSSEGSASYGDHMAWAGVASATSTGPVTASVGALGSLKVYKSNGAAQAGNGDVILGSFYLFFYVAALDSGNGGLVLK